MAKKKKGKKKKNLKPEMPPPPKAPAEFALAECEVSLHNSMEHHLKLQTKMLRNKFDEHKKKLVEKMGINIKNVETQVNCTLKAVKETDDQTEWIATSIDKKKKELMMLKTKLGMSTKKKQETVSHATKLIDKMKQTQKKKILEKLQEKKLREISALAPGGEGQEEEEKKNIFILDKDKIEENVIEYDLDGKPKRKKSKRKKIVFGLPDYEDVVDLPFENLIATAGRGHYNRYKKKKEDQINRELAKIDAYNALPRFNTKISKKGVYKKALPPFWVKYSNQLTKKIVKKNYGETFYFFPPIHE